MKYFQVVYAVGGKRNHTIIQAEHKVDAMSQFQKLSLGILVTISEINEPLSNKIKKLANTIQKNSRRKKIKLESYIATLRQLGVMVDASIPLNQAFAEVIDTTDDIYIKKIFTIISQKIESGSNITSAFAEFSYELGNVSVAIISLGEQTGSLAESINKLANILEEIHENRKKLKKALRYPMIVMIAMIGAFVAVIKMVVPQFKEMFEESNAELPMPTQILLGLEEFVNAYGFQIILFIAFMVFLHKVSYAQKGKYTYFVDKNILKIYLLGKVTKLSMLGRFIYVFNGLTHSGVPITEALKISENIIENVYIKERFSIIESSIQEGKSLSQGFENSGQFENMILQMIKAGENSGALNHMLEKIDKYYSEKYNDFVDNLSTYIEPIMIVFLASFLTLIALGIFLPMWSMADALSD